jgi:large conductance mechanosensitive channel
VSVPNVNDVMKRGHGFFQEFRAFVMRGNVVDLAVGVVIGAAFGKIVTALVDQVIMPPIGLLTSKADFSSMEWVLRPEDVAHGVKKVAIGYGAFINTLIQFLIIAFVVFLVVKMVNRLREREAAAPTIPPAPTTSEKLLEEIRDELKAGRVSR